MNDFYEIYHLLIRDKDFPRILVVEKVEFETQEAAGLVEFDYRKVMEYEDDPNTEVVGFYHTHPHGHSRMSQTDIETMKAWVTCLGRDLLCLIGTTIGSGSEEVDIVHAWRCFKKGAMPIGISSFKYCEDEYKIMAGGPPQLDDLRYIVED